MSFFYFIIFSYSKWGLKIIMDINLEKNKNLFLGQKKDLDSSVVANTLEEAILYIEIYGIPKFISFGNVDDENDSYNFAKWLIEIDLKNFYKFPENFTFEIDSPNVKEKIEINTMLNNYLYSNLYHR